METKLSKSQLRLICTARGLSATAIRERTDIPNQSFVVLMNDVGGKDHSVLMSESTLDKVMALLGVKNDGSGLVTETVIEWRPENRKKQVVKAWMTTVTTLRKQLFSTDIAIAELVTKKGMFSSSEHLILVHDKLNNFRIAFSGMNKNARNFLQELFGVQIERSSKVKYTDFKMQSQVIANNSFRVTQFMAVIGGKQFKYDWSDVQAAAKEFNFTSDELIKLMVDATYNSAIAKSAKAEPIVENIADYRQNQVAM